MRNVYSALRSCTFTLFLLFLSSGLGAQLLSSTTLAGGGAGTYRNNASATGVALSTPQSVYADKGGNIYFITGNWVTTIHDYWYDNSFISFAGTGVAGYSGDGGPAVAAQLNQPYGICQDPKGNFYIGTRGDNRIRKVGTDGNINTFAGNGSPGYAGDGGSATQASLEGLNGMCGDIKGNIYVSDSIAGVIRKIDTNGIITTIAGTGTPGYSGDGGPGRSAQLGRPNGIGIDATGNIYVGDDYVNTVRKIDTNGIITTIVGGSSDRGYSGDYGPALAAVFGNITDIYVDDQGNIYIVDPTTASIREYGVHSGIISPFTGPNAFIETSPQTSVAQSWPAGNFYVTNISTNTVDRLLLQSWLPTTNDTITQYIHAPYFSGNITNYYNSYIMRNDTAALSWYHFPSFVPSLAFTPLTNLPQGLYTFIDAVDTGIQEYNGVPVTARHFEIIGPNGEDSTTQDEVELWFHYQDFLDYDNYVAAHNLGLPPLTNNNGNKSGINGQNFRVVDFHGAASTPQIPSGSVEVIAPDAVTPDPDQDAFNDLDPAGNDDLYIITIRCQHGFSNFFLASNSGTPLPLTLLSFTAVPQGRNTVLSWTTSNEVNTQVFFVQRGTDTTALTTVGTVNAAGTGGSHSYGFADRGLEVGVYYYRLQMKDMDGHYTYSPVKSVTIGLVMGNFTLYPNPAKDVLNCQLAVIIAGKYTAELTDRDGSVLQTQQVSLSSGMTILSFDVSGLAAGVYFVTVSDGSHKQTGSFLK